MALFITDEPFFFYEEVAASDPALPPLQRAEIRFRIAITEPTSSVPPTIPVLRDFVLDTAADYASVFPADLELSQISPDGPSGGEQPIIMALQQSSTPG